MKVQIEHTPTERTDSKYNTELYSELMYILISMVTQSVLLRE